MRFAAVLAAVVLVPVAGAAGWEFGSEAAPRSPLDGLTLVDTESHYGWVVTSGKFKGQTTDPAIVLQYAPKDRPPSRFVEITCEVYADGKLTALSERGVQVCSSRTVPEAEVREALTPGPGA